MNEWYNIFSFSIISAALMLTLLGLWFTAIIPVIDRWGKRFFFAYFTVLMLCSLVSLADMILYRYIVVQAVAKIFAFFETLLLSMPLPMLTAYLVHCCEISIKKSKLFHIVLGLWSVFFLLLSSTLFSKFMYFITPDYQFLRGGWFPLLMLPLNAIMILNFVCLIRWRRLLSHKYYFGFLIAILPLTVALLVHTFTDVSALIDISMVLSAVSMFSLIMSEQIEQNLRQQREIARQQQEIAHQRASVMVLKMRPHFIYNTLMTIYSLCNQDAQKARQVTLDFTNYLRKNFNAVASEGTIPFIAELEHTKAYLGVEQAQLEDMLLVEFDTPFTQFRLPPITLQPIVENAVKHGIDPYKGPLQVTIRTRFTDSGTEVTVQDNGKGFDPYDKSKPHTALNNIKERLEMMCHGTLKIDSSSDGTTVTIFVPHKA